MRRTKTDMVQLTLLLDIGRVRFAALPCGWAGPFPFSSSEVLLFPSRFVILSCSFFVTCWSSSNFLLGEKPNMFLIFIGEGDSEDGIRSNRFVTGVSSPGVELGGGMCTASSTAGSSTALGKGGLGVE
jgi:hypothetical protein